MSPFRVWRALRHHGVLGINGRNVDYTIRWNKRHFYPNVDDKLRTKDFCERSGIAVPRLLGVARHHFELRRLGPVMAELDDFVLKPAHGAMGNGILVVQRREGERFVTAAGRRLRLPDLVYHAAGIISGLYALAGQPDEAMVEERLVVHPELAAIATDGVPDVRVVVYRGVPVMAMTRLPTRRSAGRANLHQGAVAAGIDLATGRTTHAIQQSRAIRRHPDTGEPLIGREIPGFKDLLRIAVRAADETGLGYVGADLVVDARRGPMLLEMNARPGLMVQLANRAGLLPRLHGVERTRSADLELDERLAFGVELARGASRRALSSQQALSGGAALS
jgi:alpha-L-glutamate ligase-like protein